MARNNNDSESAQFWHLCTPGKLQCLIFRNKSDYTTGMNLIALSANKFSESVEIYAFELMSNHLHFLIKANQKDAEAFYQDFYQRLRRFLGRQGRMYELNKISYSLIPVNNDTYLKNLIAYLHRNAFLVNSSIIPFSWPWGTNIHMFLGLDSYFEKVYIKTIGKRARQEMFHTRDIDFPDNYYMIQGYISPACYCKIAECELLFRSAHQYFFNISRRVELFSDIARELGDIITYTDEEIFSTAAHLSMTKYNKEKISMLDRNEKIEVAKVLHFNYNAGNDQICRVLKISDALVDSIFPRSTE